MMFPTRRICLLTCLSLVASGYSVQGYTRAPNCARYECPPYSVVYSQKEFEIRSYEQAQWVSGPNITSKSYKEAADKGFLILFTYYQGNNDLEVEINMTTPVLVDVQNSTYTVYFYVPKQYQKGGLPPPRSDKIRPVNLPRHKYAAILRFDGFITDAIIPGKVALLKSSLRETPYERAAAVEDFTLAGYNSPFELKNRVNEVLIWFD